MLQYIIVWYHTVFVRVYKYDDDDDNFNLA